MKCAVIYYSKSGTTKALAETIADRFDADIFPIEPKKAYGSYVSAVVRAGAERLAGTVPETKTELLSFDEYDVIFVGFPVWYSTMPQFMQSYLRQCRLHGKRIIPFATAGANGQESSLKTVESIFPDCSVTDYFYTSIMKKADVGLWLNGIAL